MPAQAYYAGIGDTAVQYGGKQFFLIFHLFPSSPAYPVAGHESDLVSQGFFKRVYIGIEVDVHVEVCPVIQCGNQACQVWGILVGGYDVGYAAHALFFFKRNSMLSRKMVDCSFHKTSA